MEYGLIGEVLKHSFSKEIHSRLFDYDYELCEVKKDELDGFLKRRNFKAINVTIPYKQAVIPYLYDIDSAAEKIGAVNTVVNKDGRLYGYNTDFSGLKAMLVKNRMCLENKKVLILGSGGTSKTAFAVAENMGAKEIYLVSRFEKEGFITYGDAYENHFDADGIINTTPCGMFPKTGVSAVDIKNFKNLSFVCDVIYNPLCSKLVTDAKKFGINACGGLYMLVSQAAFAAEKFTGQTVAESKITEIFSEVKSEKENIVLIGMPGCGKTTVGKILSKKTGKKFVDTDKIIEEKAGVTISKFFKTHSEEDFRDLESAVTADISKEQGLIIATGGGAVLREENVDLLKENGRLCFIDRPLDKLIATDDRPLSSNRADLEKRYRERYGIYVSRADIKVDGSINPNSVAELILKEFSN